MKNTTNNTNAKLNNNNKGENTMRTAKFGFVREMETKRNAEAVIAYDVFKGFNTEARFVMNNTIDLNAVQDKVKLFSFNYSVAGAVGIVTDGIYKFLAAETVEEISKTIKDFGSEAIGEQRYIGFNKLIKSTRVTSRLGGGQMRIKVCSKYEVIEFFRRLSKLDVNALTNEDMKAMKADMQVVGRVIQEIAIDVAKNKDLSAGIDPMNTFGSILVLSKLRAKFNSAIKDNRTEIFTMARESIAKNQAVNTGVTIDSIPDYKLEINNFKGEEYISDWAGKFQDRLGKTQEDFFNIELMPEIKKAGTTREALAIRELVVSNKPLAKEIKEIMSVYKAYAATLVVKDSGDADINSRNAIARKAADKQLKLTFRDTVYALGRAYCISEADTRKLAYGATMIMNGGINVAKANMSCIDIIGEEDTLLMWSNEEGIVRDAIEVELSDYATDNIDFSQDVNFEVEFIDDIAYDANGEEVAYGCFTNLNCKGCIVVEKNKVIFTPDRDTNIAPIGTKRVAMVNQIVINNELKSLYSEYKRVNELFELAVSKEDLLDAKSEESILNAAVDATIKTIVAHKDKLFFVGKTKTGVENAVCVIAKDQSGNNVNATIGKTIQVGTGYGADLFYKGLTQQLPSGQVVAIPYRTHKLDNIIKTNNGLLLALSC